MRTGRLNDAMVLVAALGTITATAHSKERIDSAAVRPANISWEKDSEALLVSYRDIWAQLANQDPIPLIRIFGDGRVLIHYPVYTPKAGEYELWLQPAELERLGSLLAKGLATFQPQAVESLKRLAEQRRWQAALDAGRSPELFMVADDSTSVFELHLTDYPPAGAARASGEVQRSISWLGLRTDAERYPKIEPIQQLRAAEVELRALLERDDMWRIR